MSDNFFDTRRFFNIASPQEVSPLARAYRGVTFGPTMVGKQDFARVSPGEDDIEDPYVSALSKMGAGNAINAYRSHLNTMPNQQDYAPSRGRRLAGALTAAAASFGRTPQNAIALGQQITDAPYRNALETWNLRGAGLKEQAGLEAADQTAQIARMKQILDYKDKMADNIRLDKAQQSTEAYQRARIAALQNDGWIKETGPNGELIMYNPRTGQRQDTGIVTSKATELANDATRLAQGAYGLQQGDRRIGLEAQNVGLRGQEVGISGFNAQTGRMNATTAQQESQGRMAGMGNNQVPPTEQFQAEVMAVTEALRKNPDWSGWVKDDGTIKKPGDYGWFGRAPDPNDKTYQEFLRTVDEEKRKILGLRPPGSYPVR